MTVLVVIILVSAVLLTIGVMTLSRSAAPSKKESTADKVKVKVRYAGIPSHLRKESTNAPDAYQTTEEDFFLDSLEENPLDALADKNLPIERRNEIMASMIDNGYKPRNKESLPQKKDEKKIGENIFEELDDHPCDELLEAPLDEFQDADYQ